MEFKYEDSPNKGGVYKITNNLNGRVYYGSAKGFKQRWKGHAGSLLLGKHQNRFLQADFNKCGTDAFIFEVIEVIDGTKEERLLREDYYLKQFHDHGNQCYNFKSVASSSEGNKPRNPEVAHENASKASLKKWAVPEYRAKMSGKKRSAETRQKISKHHQEHPFVFTDELRKKLSDAQKLIGNRPPNRKGVPFTEEHRRKLSEASKGVQKSPKHRESCSRAVRLRNETSPPANSKTWEFISSFGEKVMIYNLANFCRENKLSLYHMRRVFYSKQLEYKGYTKVAPLALSVFTS